MAKQYGSGQIIAGAAVFGALVGVMFVQKVIPGGDESYALTWGGVGGGFVLGLIGALVYTRRRKD